MKRPRVGDAARATRSEPVAGPPEVERTRVRGAPSPAGGLDRRATAVLERIRRARRSHEAVDLGGSAVGLDAAYRIQAALGEERELMGYKVADAAENRHSDGGVPLYGRVYGSMLLGSPVPLSRFVQPRLAPALAVVPRRDVPADAEPDAVHAALGAAFLAIEVLDSVWRGHDSSLPALVADNASGGGFVLGDRLLDWPLDGTLRLYLDGEEVAARHHDALGDPAGRVAWLARMVGGVRARQLVILGRARSPVAARAGTVELRGPSGSAVIARLERPRDDA